MKIQNRKKKHFNNNKKYKVMQCKEEKDKWFIVFFLFSCVISNINCNYKYIIVY